MTITLSFNKVDINILIFLEIKNHFGAIKEAESKFVEIQDQIKAMKTYLN